jgi:hypothetical protein
MKLKLTSIMAAVGALFGPVPPPRLTAKQRRSYKHPPPGQGEREKARRVRQRQKT